MVKYKEVAKELRKRIKNGLYPIDTALPDQKTMAVEFETSRVTIKKALDLLSVEGLVYTIQGSGTYIKKNIHQLTDSRIRIGQNVGLTHQVEKKASLTNEVLSFIVRFPNEEECDQLLLHSENPVYEIQRLRILDQKPYSIEYSVIPVEIVPNITKKILKSSVYDYIREKLGLVFGGNRQIIKAAQPDKNDQKYLNCHETEPVLEVIKVMFLENGTPFEFSKVRHRFDMVEISFFSGRNEF